MTLRPKKKNYKDFQKLKVYENCQMLKVFENLRDGSINPQEVLKTQVNFKLDLS